MSRSLRLVVKDVGIYATAVNCNAAAVAVTMLVIAGIRSAGGSKKTAEEPLQTKPAASANVPATQNRLPSKAAVPSTFTTTDRASAGSGQADQAATATAGSQLFANAGHEVVSVVADDDADDDVSDDENGKADSAGQQTLSATPYDELD